jgi:restriction system protein
MTDEDLRIPFKPVSLAPQELGREVERILRAADVGLTGFRVEWPERIAGDGPYEMDATARFEALGVDFRVLIACRHPAARVNQELVRALRDRLQDIGAQKGMMFATSGYERDAVAYARAHGIALAIVADGRTSYARSRTAEADYVPPWVPPYAAWLVGLTYDGSATYMLLDAECPEHLTEAFAPAG